MEKKQKATTRTKRPSKLDLITVETSQTHAHYATSDISRKCSVLDCEHAAVENEISTLGLRIVDARKRKSELEAQIIGLSMVIARR